MSYHDDLEIRDVTEISTVVLHCTELPTFADAIDAAEERGQDGIGNCAHYYVDKNGSVHRLVMDDRVAHHVANHNRNSIGIELINLGRFPNWFHTDSQRPTDPYPQEQMTALLDLLRVLRKEYPRVRNILRHSDLDKRLVPSEDKPAIKVRRRIDPGPLFPWNDVKRFWDSAVTE